MANNGLRYDSSLFPMKVIKYGIEKKYSLDLFDKHGIHEHYLGYMKMGSYKVPFFGGGYFRLMPYKWTKKMSQHLDLKHAVFYMHPYELDTKELAYVKSTGQTIPLKWRLSQFIGRNTIENKLNHLMKDFEFTSFKQEYYRENPVSVAQHTYSNSLDELLYNQTKTDSINNLKNAVIQREEEKKQEFISTVKGNRQKETSKVA